MHIINDILYNKTTLIMCIIIIDTFCFVWALPLGVVSQEMMSIKHSIYLL